MMRRRAGLRGRCFGVFVIVIVVNILSAVAVEMAELKEKEAVAGRVVKVKVGVVLDLNAFVGKMGVSCISMALADFYASRSDYNTRLILNTMDSNGSVLRAAAAALDLIKKEEVQAIIGPTSSMQASFMIDLGDKAQVPIISYSATQPFLTSHRSPFFFRVAQNDSSQVKAIGAIVSAFKWRRVVPIYVNNEFGEGIIPYLVDALQEVDAHVPYQSVISPTATDEKVGHELYKLMTMQTRVFVVHMLPRHASRLFAKANEIGMMKRGYVWIVTDAITNALDLIEPSTLESMQGVLGIRTHIPKTKSLESFKLGWRKRFRRYFPTEEDFPDLNVFGLWAYDAAWALAMAVEKAGVENLRYNTPANITAMEMNSPNYLYNLSVNQNGPRLRNAFSNIRFKGLAGDFGLVNGQLKSSAFEIVNLLGNGRRHVGFWTPEGGLTRKLQYSAMSSGLRSIIWPGEPSSAPKGWEIPTNGKKLRVAVPMRRAFNEFVYVGLDPKTNETQVSGYCIDVFKAVIEALPYAVAYEFIPIDTSKSKLGASYNDMAYQLFLGKFDVLVADLTIRANRSLYIDYTLPFTESGVTMVVPMKSTKNTNAWVYIKPLTGQLWALTGGFFLIIALVVWILEHRVNQDFHGKPFDQFCNSLWYSFSTMVFAQRGVTFNNWTKLVVIIWLFVVLVITQSYTASLASLLTVQELKPTVTDVNQLIKNRESIGFQGGSFVYEILKSLKFEDFQLRTYTSLEEMDELFTKGSMNGGISAALDETPYIKLFLAKYCMQYTTTEPTFKADGFGFGFPRGSPLVPDISRAILQVTESNRMKEIENTWFHKMRDCSAPKESELSSTQLSVQSFWGLFLIPSVVCLVSCIIYIGKFVYDDPMFWRNRRVSIWVRTIRLIRKFMRADNNCNRIDQRRNSF